MINNYVACNTCACVNQKSDKRTRCRRCNAKINPNLQISFHKTFAYLVTAMILFIPANIYPVMVTTQFGESQSSTIIEGIILLWSNGSYPIALIILFASVFIPIVKFILILYLLLTAKFNIYTKRVDKLKLFHMTEFIGPWSMIDVFVVSILAALIELSSIQIVPGMGITAFALMVLFTLLAALSFDTKLLLEENIHARS